ncbi:ABC transporter permease [Mesorhizobium huakuii]|uniref:ABC transporter permease n=1 Tax=Mesorhizobium huakuii TaxID=28104 RepID=A0ABZ0VSE0_9HYPH|nr:ABC transporter permease [Mesorhizobium huakuii]WQB98491.1 ABC transporter permease [Mesorhizobium huakuii]
MTRLRDALVGLRVVMAVAVALGLGSILILATGADPVKAYAALVHEALFDYWGLSNTIVKTSPILLASLAVMVPLRAGVYNIGGEGQIYMGGLFGTLAALHLPALPSMIAISVALMCAMLGGALWAAIAGLLKAWRGINEVIVTLLMNYIAIHVVSFAVSGPMIASGAPYPYSDEIPEQYRLPLLMPQTDAHIGIIFGVVAAGVIAFIFARTATGLSLDIVGRSPRAARYAGLNVKTHIVASMASGGMLAGLAGGIEVLGLKYRLFHLFSPGYGFDGVVAAFIANANPAFAPLSALFLGALKSGASVMQRAAGVEGTVVDAIVGLVVILVAASLAWKGDLLGGVIERFKLKAMSAEHANSTERKS